ncbi:hypothetical protein [Paenibacillus sp. GCM10027626]|uniref:hypothetical protein n=1 Tax=Paenibacillus sp. GCM10027626 TaxID=3273411 RepID=UPI00362C0897
MNVGVKDLFELSKVLENDTIKQKIVHFQQPDYYKEYILSAKTMIEVVIVPIVAGRYCLLIMI